MLGRILRLPPFLCAASFAAATVAQAVVPVRLGVRSAVAGGAIGLAGVLIAAAALIEMTRHGTPVEPGQQPTALVTTGVFRLTRNPIYLSMVMTVAAVGLMIDSLWFPLAAAVLCIALDRLVIAGEERILDRAFTAEYAAYRRRVRRWL